MPVNVLDRLADVRHHAHRERGDSRVEALLELDRRRVRAADLDVIPAVTVDPITCLLDHLGAVIDGDDRPVAADVVADSLEVDPGPQPTSRTRSPDSSPSSSIAASRIGSKSRSLSR